MTVLDPADKRARLAELLRRRAQRAQPVDLSAAQYRLWLQHELEPDGGTYNVPYAFELRGALDREALRRALNTIAQRHDVLRARIVVRAGAPAYAVDADYALELPVVDAADRDRRDEILARESARPFDLATDVPLRALLVRSAADDHVLLVTLHHITTDGWSMGVFKRELSVLYAAHREREPSPLPEPACTYADYARWQDGAPASTAYAEQLAYWKAQLADAPEPLAFEPPRDGVVPGTAGALRGRVLDADVSRAFEQRCRASGTTVFATLFAVFGVLLHRYTGRGDFIIGSAFANRARPEFEDVIGFFVNTLPLRVRIDADVTFADWLERVQHATIDAFDRQDVAYQTIVETTRAKHGAGHSGLVNVMFVVNNAPDAPLELAGLEVAPVTLARTTAKFDLTLEATPGAAGLHVAFEYRTALFAPATIDALLDALGTLVEAVAREPRQPIAALPLLSPAARARQLYEWNDTARPLSGQRIERLFERQAERRGDAVAIVDGTQQMSYRALNERADLLAAQLRSCGVADGARVGLCFERGANAVIALLAILKAGAIYVPLEPAYPSERLRHLLADAGVALVVTETRRRTRLETLGARTIALDGPTAKPAAEPLATAAEARGSSAGAAYVMYTSGSTGVPKGVVVTHAGIERLACGADYAHFAPGDTVAHAATLAFDASTFEIWGALLNGGRIAIVPAATLLAPALLRTAIERQAIATMFVTAAVARELARSVPSPLIGLRTLIVGGDVFDADTAGRLRAALPGLALWNGYGPTETTTFATVQRVDEVASGAAIPIGRPIANTRTYILDHAGRLLPAGASGELFIGGPGVALGYLNDDRRTAEKFRPDPFDPHPGARLYATGDRARYRPDGAIEFLGRADRQIKRRGFRIEPGEIEAALRADTGVGAALLIADDDGAGEPRLIAYVAVGDAPATAGDAVARRLRERLPAFMLPDRIVALPVLPLQINGKIDRDALARRALPAAPAQAPQTEAEAALRALWEELLGRGPIGIDDDFFAAGGHSLLAVRMLREIAQRFRIELPAAILFERPTIAQLARAMCDAAAQSPRVAPVAFNASGARRPFFFLHGSIGGGGFYCRTLAQRLGAERPLYAIRPHGGSGEPLPPIDAMAADTVALIRSIQPRGPYLLGGYCNGGLVAFEAARRLRAGGDEVANVVLLDVPAVSATVRRAAAYIEGAGRLLRVDERARSRAVAAVARVPHHLARFAASDAKTRSVQRALLRAMRGRRRHAAPAASDAAAVEAWMLLTERYVPRRFDGRLTLLVTPALRPGDDAGRHWLSLASETALFPLEGRHLTCLSDFIDRTADVLANVLRFEP